MKVRATKLGFYDLKRRREGDEFVLHDPKLFSEKWMERIDGKKKPKVEVESIAVSEPEVSSEDEVI